jgi:hypothetical protein
MRRAIRRYVTGGLVTVAAVTIGVSVAPSAAADPNCQTVGAATVCGQGTVSGGNQSGNAPLAPAPPTGGPAGGCTNAFGAYQRC